MTGSVDMSALLSDRRRVFGLVVLVFAALVVLVSWVMPSGGGGLTPAGGLPIHPRTTATATEPSPSTARPDNPRESATEAARLYIVAFFDPSLNDREWHDAIDAQSTTTLASLNETVPRSSVPKAHLLSLRVTGQRATYAEVQARMSDGMVLFIAVVLDAGEWKVNEFAPVTK